MTEDYQPLHLKYRPHTLGEVAGNKATVQGLANMLAKPGKPHAYLLSGPSGCGKTTLARIIARELGAGERDFHELNSAHDRSVDGIRSLYSAAARRPWQGEVSVYLLDEAHQLTRDAQNAVLKLLEEPPRHAYFILATTDPERLINTIRTRCSAYAVQALPRGAVVRQLEVVCEAEECPEGRPTRAVLKEIARVSQGSMRQALMALDQVIDIEDEDEALDAVMEAVGDDYQAIELCRALYKGRKWPAIQKVLQRISAEPEQVRQTILSYFERIILTEPPGPAYTIVQHFEHSMIYAKKANLALACWRAQQAVQAQLAEIGDKE